MSKPTRYWPGKTPLGYQQEEDSSSSSGEEDNQIHSQPLPQVQEKKAFTIISVDSQNPHIKETPTGLSKTLVKENVDYKLKKVKEEDEQEEEESKKRERIKALALKRMQEEEEEDVDEFMDVQQESEEDEEETDSQEEEESEEEEIRPLFKPVFISKSNRDPSVLKEEKARLEREAEESRLKEIELRKLEAHNLVAQELKREYEASQMMDNELQVDDTDGINPEQEQQEWVLRELNRIKRDKLEKQSRQEELLDKLQRKQKTDEELEREKQELMSKIEKPKMKFLQKYYHKGAFYHDDTQVSQALDSRNFTQATEQDSHDKSILPKVMQVKNFGLSGRTKYTHLVDQDTTLKDAGWAQGNMNDSMNKMGGMKKPLNKKRRI